MVGLTLCQGLIYFHQTAELKLQKIIDFLVCQHSYSKKRNLNEIYLFDGISVNLTQKYVTDYKTKFTVQR